MKNEQLVPLKKELEAYDELKIWLSQVIFLDKWLFLKLHNQNLLILYECQHFAVLGYFFRKSKILNGRHLSKLTEIASNRFSKFCIFIQLKIYI